MDEEISGIVWPRREKKKIIFTRKCKYYRMMTKSENLFSKALWKTPG